MIYSLENDLLSVKINSRGGELWSVKDKGSTEYLWQGNAKYWEDRAPNLFPQFAIIAFTMDNPIPEPPFSLFLDESTL